MLIDWFTVGAQALNFLILVWLMKRFLYKPILDAIDARERRIAKEIAEADAGKAEAAKEREEYRRKNETFDKERADRAARAAEDAKAEAARLLADARKAADALGAKRREALANEARNLSEAVLLRTQEEVFAIARKALGDLASTGLEQALAGVFIRKLGEMDAPSKAVFGAALKSGESPALVRSAFELPRDARDALRKALNETFAAEVRLDFLTAPDRIGGIEVAANGQKLAWSIADYLDSLQAAVAGLADPQAKGRSAPAPNPTPGTSPATQGAPDGSHA